MQRRGEVKEEGRFGHALSFLPAHSEVDPKPRLSELEYCNSPPPCRGNLLLARSALFILNRQQLPSPSPTLALITLRLQCGSCRRSYHTLKVCVRAVIFSTCASVDNG